MIKYELDIHGFLNCLVFFVVPLRKGLSHFWRIRTNGKIVRITHFLSHKNDVILHILPDQGFKGTVVNRHCHPCTEGHLKLRLRSLHCTMNIWNKGPSYLRHSLRNICFDARTGFSCSAEGNWIALTYINILSRINSIGPIQTIQ